MAGMATIRKKTEITIETRQIVVIGKRRSVRSWCEKCGREVEMVGLEDATAIAGINRPMLADGTVLHWHISPDQKWVCLKSLSTRETGEDFMKKHALKDIAVVGALVGLMFSASSTLAQGKLAALKRNRAAISHVSQSTSRPTPAPTPAGSAYTTFSYIDYPQAPYTAAIGINSGAASSKMEIVGVYGPDDPLGPGFLMFLDEAKHATVLTYETVTSPDLR
jgi:hypothetical protein